MAERLADLQREWLSARHALACIDFPEGFVDRVPDAVEDADWTPLDSYLVGKHGLHVHLFGFAFGSDDERRDVCLSCAERLVGRQLLGVAMAGPDIYDPFKD